MSGTEHHGANSVTLGPGQAQTLVWKFDKPVDGEIVFACAIPRHYEAGRGRGPS